MNISTMLSILDGKDSAPWSMELKPAVRTVADWNAAAKNCCPGGRLPMVPGLLYSNIQNSAVPPTSKSPVITSTSLVCSDMDRKSRLR